MHSKILMGACLAAGLMGCNSKEEKKEEKPNFLYILADDQTYESIRCLNNDEVKTPNLDKLVKNGVTFTHCFNQGSWSDAVCVASRTMIMTGQTLYHAQEFGQYLPGWAKTELSDDKKEVKLWPEVFSDAGYETFLTGKWHNNHGSVMKSFKYAEGIGEGMYETFDKNRSNKSAYNRPSAGQKEWVPYDKKQKGHWLPYVHDMMYDEEGNKYIESGYKIKKHTSNLYTDYAVNFLQTKVKDSDNPFFMYVAYNAPHDPRQSPKEYVDMYPAEKVKIPDNYLPEHPFDQGDRLCRDEKLAPFPRTKEAVQLHRSEYYAIITHLDDQVGRILEALEKSGKKDNTYIIFTADHGLAVGQHGLMGKQNQYDHSVRVPMIICGPGMEAGLQRNDQVYLQSAFATTCELAGLPVPETVEFPSLKEMAENKIKHQENEIYGAYKDLQRMIRTDEYKLIVYPKVGKMQLFSMEQDPKEMNNLINQPAYAKVKKEMMDKLEKKRKELGDQL